MKINGTSLTRKQILRVNLELDKHHSNSTPRSLSDYIDSIKGQGFDLLVAGEVLSIDYAEEDVYLDPQVDGVKDLAGPGLYRICEDVLIELGGVVQERCPR